MYSVTDVLIAYKNQYRVDKLDLSLITNSVPGVNILGCKIHLCNFSLFLYNLYIPPDISVLEFETLFELLETILMSQKSVLIVGDFNIPNFQNTTHHSKSQVLCNFLNLFGLQQFNKVNNVYGRVLDLVIG